MILKQWWTKSISCLKTTGFYRDPHLFLLTCVFFLLTHRLTTTKTYKWIVLSDFPFPSQKKKIQLKPRFSETERKTNRVQKNLKYSCLQVTYLELRPPPPARGPETVALQPEASPWCLSARLDVCCWWSREVWVWVWIWDVQPTDQGPHRSRGCCHGYYFPILWYYGLHRSGWLVSDWGLWLAVY